MRSRSLACAFLLALPVGGGFSSLAGGTKASVPHGPLNPSPPPRPLSASAEGGKTASPTARLALCKGTTPETTVATLLTQLRQQGRGAAPTAGPLLVSLLPERSPLYQGRGPHEVSRLRGYLYLTLADIGPPAEALPFLLAELAHGHRPYPVAAAARAAAAMGPGAAAAVPHLRRLLQPDFHDDQVSFEAYNPEPPWKETTTARQEAARALERIGTLPPPAEAALASDWLPADRRPESGIGGLPALDHEGHPLELADFQGKPWALTFFYTRCDNPNKCSLTVSRLARLQRLLEEAGLATEVRLAAVTYDPRFDTLSRLQAYGEQRGLVLGEGARLLRLTPADQERLNAALEVQVNEGAGQINTHGLQLFVFDRESRTARRYHDVIWQPDQVLQDLRRLLAEPAR